MSNSGSSSTAAAGDEPDARPLSPPQTHRDTSSASSPFLMTATTDGGSSSINVMKKGRFTVKTTAIGGVSNAPPKGKETITPATGKAKLLPRTNVLSSDRARTPDVDNYDAFGLNLINAHVKETKTIPASMPRRRQTLQSTQSFDSYNSYISDDSSSSDRLDDYEHGALSPDQQNWELEKSPDMTYSPEHLNHHSPGKQSHFETTIDPTIAAPNDLLPYESMTSHMVGRKSRESLSNSVSISSSLCRENPSGYDIEQTQFNDLLPYDQFGSLPLPQQQRRCSSVLVSSVRPPTLKMRCNSEPLFSSQSAGQIETSNGNIANYPMEDYDRNDWTSYSSKAVYSRDNSESIDQDLPAMTSTPLSLPESDVIPSGRKVPLNINSSSTSTPTRAGGAKQFYSNQQSAQHVAELQATVPIAHRPYLDCDESDLMYSHGLTPHSLSNTNTPTSTTDDDRDHMYWGKGAAYFPDLLGYELHPSRWAMLLYLSLLNLLSGWICFSIAPVATILGGDIDTESPVSLFLIGSAVATFCAPVLISCIGVRRTVLLGGLLLLVGLNVCCASSNVVEGLQIGFIIAGVSQPLYQITPVFVVSKWFPPKEHTTMMRTVLQSNQLGILFSFLCGTFLVSSENDILPYFQCIILLTTILLIVMVFHFQEAPPVSPMEKECKDIEQTFLQQSHHDQSDDESTGNGVAGDVASTTMDFSSVYTEKLKDEKGHYKIASYGSIDPVSPFPILRGSFTPRGQLILASREGRHEASLRNEQVFELMKTGFSKEGFTRCSIAFITSGVVATSLITYMAYLVGVSGSSKVLVGAIGSAFQLSMMMSPSTVDKLANPVHRHSFLAASLLAGVVALMMCMIAIEWNSFAGFISGLLTVALIVGSSQTLSIARGTEISQMSEHSVLVVFRLLSNIFSSVAIHLFRLFQTEAMAESAPEFSLSFIFLIAMNMIAATCFFGGNRNFTPNVQQKTERYPFLPPQREFI